MTCWHMSSRGEQTQNKRVPQLFQKLTCSRSRDRARSQKVLGTFPQKTYVQMYHCFHVAGFLNHLCCAPENTHTDIMKVADTSMDMYDIVGVLYIYIYDNIHIIYIYI